MLPSLPAEYLEQPDTTSHPFTISFAAPTYLFVDSMILKQGQGRRCWPTNLWDSALVDYASVTLL